MEWRGTAGALLLARGCDDALNISAVRPPTRDPLLLKMRQNRACKQYGGDIPNLAPHGYMPCCMCVASGKQLCQRSGKLAGTLHEGALTLSSMGTQGVHAMSSGRDGNQLSSFDILTSSRNTAYEWRNLLLKFSAFQLLDCCNGSSSQPS